MKLVNDLNKIDKGFAWSFFGFLLAMIFGVLTIYLEFFEDTRPDLRYEIISNTSVLDVKEDLGNLEIVYDGIDIKNTNQSLRVILFRSINRGNEDIIIDYYDRNAPLGLVINEGNIIRAEVVGASNDYLKNNLKITSQDSISATFTPVILETKESFTIKVLVLHPEASNPEITPLGKIARVKSIQVVQLYEENQQSSYLQRTFNGSFWVQILRAPVYFFGFIILLFAVFSPTIWVSGKLSIRKRNKEVKVFKNIKDISLEEDDEKIFNLYIERDLSFLVHIEEMLTDKDSLEILVNEIRSGTKPSKITHGMVVTASGAPPIEHTDLSILEHEIVNMGLLNIDDDSYNLNERMLNVLKEFIRFVTIRRK